MKLLIAFTTYPRKNIEEEEAAKKDKDYNGESITYRLLKRTFTTLMADQDLSDVTIEIIVIGDDYPNIDELAPIFNGYSFKLHNINQNDALRNKTVSNNHVKWLQSVQRSKIFLFETALSCYKDFDYVMTSADDEIYCNKKIRTSVDHIIKYNKPDLVFSLGIFLNKYTLPHRYNIADLTLNYPTPGNCITTGCFYKISNTSFITDLITQRKNKWQNVANYLVGKPYGPINPEDYEMWNYLLPKFEENVYSSLLIPAITVSHETEKTIYKYIGEDVHVFTP
jgi:hypothetical protein